MSLTLLLLLLAGQAQAPATPAAAPKAEDQPLGICEVMRDLDKFKDKDVFIRGFVGGDRYTGYYLADNLEGRPCDKMPRKAKNWPSTLHLHWYGETQTDKLLESFVTQRDREHKDKMVVASFRGTINLAKKAQIIKDVDGGYFGSGYGSNGQHPAQVTVRRVTDVVLQ